MVKRKGIGKKVRFEVFKRDSFRCQYCGGTAPDVILVIDHIKPVKEGGTNEIINLITSCQDCNSGKGARLLDDDSIILKQRKQLEELNERREQLEMMMTWREGLKELESDQVEIINGYIKKHTGWGLNEYGKKGYFKMLKKHGLQLILDSIDAAVSQYVKYDENEEAIESSVDKMLTMIPKICNCKQLEKNKPYMKNLFYVRGILRNRVGYHIDWMALKLLEDAYLLGASIESLKETALTAHNWSQFRQTLEVFIEENAEVK